MKNLNLFIALVLVLVSSVSSWGQTTTKTLTKTLPQSDTINVSTFPSTVEIIETLEDFAHIEVEVKVNTTEAVTNKLLQAGAFTINYEQHETDLFVQPAQSEFFITVQGRDLDIKRKFKLYVPRGTYVVERNTREK